MNTASKRSVALGIAAVVLLSVSQSDGNAAAAEAPKRVFVSRLYTGPDNQSHFEEVEVTFTAGGAVANVSKLMTAAGAELRRTPAGTFQDWHTASRRQYIITISGRTEIEIGDGRKNVYGPGHISLVEDLTGKGHITRAVGPEDVVNLVIPVAEQAAK